MQPLSSRALSEIEGAWNEYNAMRPVTPTGVPEVDTAYKLAEACPLLLGEIIRLRRQSVWSQVWRSALSVVWAFGVVGMAYASIIYPELSSTAWMFAGLFMGLWMRFSK